MRNLLFLLVFWAVAVAPAAGLAQDAARATQGAGKEAGTIPAGGMRLKVQAPQPDKWNLINATPQQRLFKCKPLACAVPQSVTIAVEKSPTRNPDPKALEHYATVEFPKILRALIAARSVMNEQAAKIETVNSKVATLKGYPGVLNESKYAVGKNTTTVQIAIIFSGPIMIKFVSVATDRQLAKKALDDFVAVTEIEEGPALPPPAASKPQAPEPSKFRIPGATEL